MLFRSRGYRAFDLPGMDLLHDALQLNTAKQVQSAARQLGKNQILSELYGLTGWDCSFATFKAQGDWQAALGVTCRVPHLAWYSMRGEAKRDCPGPISHQQPWWQEWRLLEDHFARLATILTRGRPCVRIAVIHPIESFWLSYGPERETAAERQRQERRFQELTEWLLGGLVDFDFVSEAWLAAEPPHGSGAFRVGEMAYEAVLVPPLITLRASTLERLERFTDGGGAVIFLGEPPRFVDVAPSPRPAVLADRARRVAFEREAILAALAPWREAAATGPEGAALRSLLCQLREADGGRYAFLCHLDRANPVTGAQLRFRGTWRATELDTLTGETRPLPTVASAGWTSLCRDFPAAGHLLLRLDPGVPDLAPPGANAAPVAHRIPLAAPASVELSEPNVLLLDRPAWRWNDGPWQAPSLIPAIEDQLRRQHGLQVRRSYCAQPWSDGNPAPELGWLELAFDLDLDVALSGEQLALEVPETWNLYCDGRPVIMAPEGWWVDEAIRRVALPDLAAGRHRLELRTRFTRQTELESFYLLGDFSVRLSGASARLGPPVRRLDWGDWTVQGLPFYTGNVVYRCPITTDGGALMLEAEPAPAPLLAVSVDGRDCGRIAFPPYQRELGALPPGRHELAITAFGHRHNLFAAGLGHAGGYTLQPMGPRQPPALKNLEVRGSV